MNPGEVAVDWSIHGVDDSILIYQAPRKGRSTVLSVLLTQDQAREVAAKITAMLAAGPPEEEWDEIQDEDDDEGEQRNGT